MPDIFEDINCCVCDNKNPADFKVLYQKEKFSVVECNKCSFTFIPPYFRKQISYENYKDENVANAVRNGNNFVVWNSELRWPIFKYLLNRPIRSDFVQNFQIIGFGDLGMAWYDVNPYSDENVLNKNVYVGNPVTLTIFNQKEPIVGGYGFGLRSRLLGYFIRVDFAWGVDDKKVQKGMTYLSLTTDF